jgi:hypothetical protein
MNPVVMPRLSRVSTSFSRRPQQKASMAGQTRHNTEQLGRSGEADRPVPGGSLMDCDAQRLVEHMTKVSHLTSPTLAMERQWTPGDSRRQIPI